ncbi:hypothetical protein K443DRAFT_118008, partial [Laccaria amethystina LaAM-08-1]
WALVVVQRLWWWALVAIRPHSQAIIIVRRRTCWAPMDVHGRSSLFLNCGGGSMVVVRPHQWW